MKFFLTSTLLLLSLFFAPPSFAQPTEEPLIRGSAPLEQSTLAAGAPIEARRAYFLGSWQPDAFERQKIQALLSVFYAAHASNVSVFFTDGNPNQAMQKLLFDTKAKLPENLWLLAFSTQSPPTFALYHSKNTSTPLSIPDHPDLFSALQSPAEILQRLELVHALIARNQKEMLLAVSSKEEHPKAPQDGSGPAGASEDGSQNDQGIFWHIVLVIGFPFIFLFFVILSLFVFFYILSFFGKKTNEPSAAEKKNIEKQSTLQLQKEYQKLMAKYPEFFKELRRRSLREHRNFDAIFELFDKNHTFPFERPPQMLLDATDKRLLLERYYAESLDKLLFPTRTH